MNTISVTNVNTALPVGLKLLANYGELHASRAGTVLRLPGPVSTTYENPMECVLFDPVRNANPFFHFFEVLWILAGRSDVRFIERFNAQMAQYSDDGVTFHGAYGERLRRGPDQIEALIRLLHRDPSTRRAVLQIWDASDDLGTNTKDLPCNTTLMFNLRSDERLHLTVCNRSNDMIWGAYGTNAVQFGLLLAYICARTSMDIGTYTQMSNDFHVYTDNPFWVQYIQEHGEKGMTGDWDCYGDANTVANLRHRHGLEEEYSMVEPYDLFGEQEFDDDLAQFFAWYDNPVSAPDWKTEVFPDVVMPLYSAWRAHKDGDAILAMHAALACAAKDWSTAAVMWLLRAQQRKGGA